MLFQRINKLSIWNTLLSVKYFSTGVIENIRVLDLTRIVAGPYCTMILGDLGADVIKIEQPGSGDETRHWPPFTIGDKDLSCYFSCLNRNKKSLCVNLKSFEGKKIIYELSKKSDVLVENYVPGKLDSLDLGFETINAIAPQLIYCSITGYGLKGPYMNRPGYDVIAASIGGLVNITGPKDGEPCKVGVAMTDIATGLYAHGAILAALLERSKTNLGQRIDCNLLNTQLACLINIGSNYLNAKKEANRWGTAHESIVPYEAFRTANGYITVGAGSDSQFVSLCKRLKLDHLIKDERFLTNKLRVQNRNILLKLLKSVFIKEDTSTLLKLFEGASFPYGPINKMSEVFEDMHVKEINLVKPIKAEGGTLNLVGPAVEFSQLENSIRSPPPKLAQDTVTVLQELLNYSNKKIDTLRRNGDIQ
ncbi:succinate--hydroxymethylglutarate CoA-transferase [Halyomorpha halys]|uniref:succinate--hydroxymethylglutarate CoA-transferase n=1 Tax=Halyomorpha halys TaxID=286706 RepID=UPI0006D4E7AD|nr:succinate--hydroxymethylglutarate CoA-transferase [Halyomorpha halys]